MITKADMTAAPRHYSHNPDWYRYSKPKPLYENADNEHLYVQYGDAEPLCFDLRFITHLSVGSCIEVRTTEAGKEGRYEFPLDGNWSCYTL